MFVFHVTLPPGTTDYQLHQHLHPQFPDGPRRFLCRRTAGGVDVVSAIPPKCPAREVSADKFPVGVPLAFSADLVICRSKSSGEKYDVRSPDDRRAWLRRQMGECATVHYARFDDGWITLGNNVRRVVAKCSGSIEIHDAEAFHALALGGIGRNKAFGCGLVWVHEVMG